MIAGIGITRNIDVTVGLGNGALSTIVSVSKTNNGRVENVKVCLNATEKEHSLDRLDFKFIAMDMVYIVRN